MVSQKDKDPHSMRQTDLPHSTRPDYDSSLSTPHLKVNRTMKTIDHSRLDKIVSDARKAADTRAEGYRERALKIYPWICGRCAREFTTTNLRELTVHHRNHNHDDNPSDGSNWELLCLYCHDNEHQKQIEADRGYTDSSSARSGATHNPFAALQGMLKNKS